MIPLKKNAFLNEPETKKALGEFIATAPRLNMDSKCFEFENEFSKFSGAGIEIRPMIAGNIQRQPFYSKYITKRYNLPGTEFIHNCGFYCGNYPELSETDLETISSCLRAY